MRCFLIACCYLLICASPALAGGIIGDALEAVGLPGKELDEAHRQFKESLPIYKAVEEASSQAVRKVANEINGEVIGRATEQWIRHSRDEVRRSGASPLPVGIRAAFSPYFPAHILDSVRVKKRGFGFLNVANPSINVSGKDAIVLIDVIVFRDDYETASMYLWAHELQHVVQYAQWGLADFSKRYVKQYGEIERAADNRAIEILRHMAQNPTPESSKLVDSYNVEDIINSRQTHFPPDDVAFGCRFNDKSTYVFDRAGDGYPGGRLLSTRNDNMCHSYIVGTGADLCVDYSGYIRSPGGSIGGKCNFVGNGFFFAPRRFRSYTNHIQLSNGGQTVENVSVDGPYRGPDDYGYLRYTFTGQDGYQETVYYSESTGVGLFAIKGEDFGSSSAEPKQIVSYWGDTVFSDGVSSQYLGPRPVNTRFGTIESQCYRTNKTDGNAIVRCIAPGVGVILEEVILQGRLNWVSVFDGFRF